MNTETPEQLHADFDQRMVDMLERIEVKLRNDPCDLSLNEWVAVISQFDRSKFGHVPVTGTMLKLVTEVCEVFNKPTDGLEYADVMILLASIAARSGVHDLATPLAQKLLLIRGQVFVMQPNGTGNRIKTEKTA